MKPPKPVNLNNLKEDNDLFPRGQYPDNLGPKFLREIEKKKLWYPKKRK
jgi:hypothetical protein